jgi:hypothetical protein
MGNDLETSGLLCSASFLHKCLTLGKANSFPFLSLNRHFPLFQTTRGKGKDIFSFILNLIVYAHGGRAAGGVDLLAADGIDNYYHKPIAHQQKKAGKNMFSLLFHRIIAFFVPVIIIFYSLN